MTTEHRLQEGQSVRVVRANGDVNTDWFIHHLGTKRVLLLQRGTGFSKYPSRRLVECWQRGGICVRTEDCEATCG